MCDPRPVADAYLVATIVLAIALLLCIIALIATRRSLERTRNELDRLRERTRPSSRRRRSARAVRTVVGTAVEGATRLREQGVTGLLTSSIEDLTRWSLEDRTEIDRFTAPDGSLTVLFSDIEDSTTLNDQLGDGGWVALLGVHDKLIRRVVERHHGHIVKSQGDGFMIVFADPGEAVRCGIGIQDVIGASASWRLRRSPIKVRVGMHCGTAIQRDGDYFGRNVAMAARVAAHAAGGQILVSDEVRHELREDEDVVLVDFCETELKGLPGVHRLWEVAVL